MRRLVAASLLAVAAVAAAAPASAGPAPCYGADAGSLHAGVCGGIACARICAIEPPSVYCYDDTGSTTICGPASSSIG